MEIEGKRGREKREEREQHIGLTVSEETTHSREPRGLHLFEGKGGNTRDYEESATK